MIMWWPTGAVICGVLLILFCVVCCLIFLSLGPAARQGDRQLAAARADRIRRDEDDALVEIHRAWDSADREDRS